MWNRLFLDHPRSVGESYFEHQRASLTVAAALLGAGLAACVHAVIPSLFRTTGSRTIARLHRQITERTAPRPVSEK
ncbi:MAG: capsule biosynthesis protein [Rhizorhabdus sp.]|nr:capsule biosynthesis protein [Rhizorhabdus sp.]